MNPEEEIALLKMKVSYLEESLIAVELSNTQIMASLQDKSIKLSKAENDLSLARQRNLKLDADIDVARKKFAEEKAKADLANQNLFLAKKHALEERYEASQEKKRSEGMRYHLMHEVKKDTLAKLDGYLMALADVGDDGGADYAEVPYHYELQE